jgi:hypothetical protein
MELGKETHTPHTNIVDDMAYAISFFAQKASQWNQQALHTISRFPTHISTIEEIIENKWIEARNQKKLRAKFILTLWEDNKYYFDTEMQNAYTAAITLLWWVPEYTNYVKDSTSYELATALDTSNKPQPHDRY